MKKRLIVSKWDGKNYLGYAPDGTIHNMRKSKGGFYLIAYKSWLDWWLGTVTVGDALKSDQFILKE